MARHVVITGGSRGIGAETVRAFAAAGDRVTFFYEANEAAAQAVAAETGAAAIRCDVSDEAAVSAAFSALPRTDVLICCAGIAHYGLISDISPAQWDRLFAVNVRGAYLCVRAALPSMLHEQNGVILTVSSMWGQVGGSCEVAYSATKGALIAMTKALAKELGPSHIRVNAVAPGVIETDMLAPVDAGSREALRDETPLERLGTPRDVANALSFLASDRADFITGQVLGVSGGFVI